MAVIKKSMFPLGTGVNNILSMKKRFDDLQTQLGTKEKYATLADMGTDRHLDLVLRQRLARTEAYRQNVDVVKLRLDTLDTAMTRMSKLEGEARTESLKAVGGKEAPDFQAAQGLSTTRLDELLNLLNTEVSGRYVFAGNKTEDQPVETMEKVMNGNLGRAGFKQVLGERRQADLGANHLGRLAMVAPNANNEVGLAEDGVHSFGIKLSTISTTDPNITVTAPAGQPKALSVGFGATLPTAGQSVSITLTLADGSQETLKLVAGDANGIGKFKIGADAATTAQNFHDALRDNIKDLAETRGDVASNNKAADDFFFGPGGVPKRVVGPPFDTAVQMVDATQADTVFWYKGGDSANPRAEINSRVADGTTVNYGVQANEQGFAAMAKGLALMSVQVLNKTDPKAGERYEATVMRQRTRFVDAVNTNGSIAGISVELGMAKVTTKASEDRNTATKTQVDNMLEDLEVSNPTSVAMELLALKTRLESSYQATSLLSQLSLINYMK